MTSVVKVISREELEKMHTGTLMRRRADLLACEESFQQSDRFSLGQEPNTNENSLIEFKNTRQWEEAYRDVKEILSTRENVPGGNERKAKRKVSKRAQRRDPKLCPLCAKRLSRVAKGTRRKNQCYECKAVLAKELNCIQCNTNRVWRGPLGIVCHGCGYAQT